MKLIAITALVALSIVGAQAGEFSDKLEKLEERISEMEVQAHVEYFTHERDAEATSKWIEAINDVSELRDSVKDLTE